MTKAAAGVITREAYRRTSLLFWRHTTSIALWVLALSPFDAVYADARLTEGLVIFWLSAAMCVPLVVRA